MNFSRRIKQSLVGWKLAFALAAVFAGERGLPPIEAIGNFGRVNNSLYRGAQPNDEGIKSLKRLGVKTIINLRMPGAIVKTEEDAARANGITCTNVPLAGLGRPSDAEVAKILGLIENSPSPVFVHCEHGCDRTGTIIACYRIQHDGWTGEAALAEAETYGISNLERGMRSYIMDFARKQNNGKALRNTDAKSP